MKSRMDKFDYKVTMIVPIYNMEEFLATCLDSLVNQTIAPEEMEIMLIDDGSPDNSIDIMEEYASKYSNMTIYRKENEGLSPTRNYGIKRAKGKYIMYIDADDTLSPDTVKSVTDYFDKHYDEVDLVTYKEIPLIAGKEGKPHYRYQTLTQTGIYDLNIIENAFISQTRVNVCVKNLGEDNVLFDPDREFRHEDQKYCIEVLRRKMKIGYCDKGVYYYLHQPQSIVRTFFYAYYIFEKTMKFWEDVFAYYDGTEVPYYIQALYLNDISWKTCSDILLPYHYEKEKFEEAQNRVLRLLDKIEDEIILLHPSVDGFHRHYYLNMKKDNKFEVLSGPNEIVITNHGEVVYETKKIEIILVKFKPKGNKLRFTAFVKSALFNYLDKPVLYMIENNDYKNPKEIDLRLSSWSYYRAKTKTNNFWLFDLEIDTKKVKTFEFRIGVENRIYRCSYWFMPRVIFNHTAKRYEYFKDEKKFKFDDGIFQIRKAKAKDVAENLKIIRGRYKRSNKKLWLFRNFCTHKIKRFENVWLYHDCKGVKEDNGYYQFVHDIEKKDGVRRYYVINEEKFRKAKKNFPRKYRKHMIRFGGPLHKYLFLKARKIITAFIEPNNYMPFMQKRMPKYNEVSNDPDIIYLQHGVLHAHVPWKYSLDRLGIEKEVISTRFERENLINNYCFREDALIPCGMPRYDTIDMNQESVNRILFAPSWRKYLVGMVGTEWVTTEGKFLNSKFFEETNKFLNSEKLQSILEKNDFYLDFKLHPILERYKHLYKITNPRVTMAENRISETQYKIFMTDFSSFVFDFVYLERPIIYFIPDEEMFRAGMNDYREIDIPFEDAFGDLTVTAEETVEAVERVLKNGCRPEKKYADRMTDFFFYKDDKQTERLYQALIED